MLVRFRADYGMFACPMMAAERVSYPVPPFSTVRGMLEALYWKRGLRWEIRRVWVLSPVRCTVQVGRREVKPESSGEDAYTLRGSGYLKSPDYVVSAEPRGPEEGKYAAQLADWLRTGRSRCQVFMGVRECGAHFGLPPPDFADMAARANPQVRSVPRMPERILYSRTVDHNPGNPIGVVWADYAWDAASGSYAVDRVDDCVQQVGDADPVELAAAVAPRKNRGGPRSRLPEASEPPGWGWGEADSAVVMTPTTRRWS